VAGGGWLYLSRLNQPPRTAAPSIAGTSEPLPEIALPRSDAGGLTRIELTRPNDDGQPGMQTITLRKQGPAWEMTSPLTTRASLSKVSALIDNLQNLHLWTMLDGGTGLYDQYDLGDSKALHIVAWKGPDRGQDKVIDLFCGKSGPQGQLVRLGGRDGTFALVNWGPQGYAGFLYARDVRSWRETSILKFDEDDAVRIEIINPNGFFSFSKNDGEWKGSFTRRGKSGNRLAPAPTSTSTSASTWRGFDPSRVRALLAAYRSLDADDFAQPEDRPRSGVDDAERTGGVIRIKLRNGAADLVVRIGKLTMSTSRWAIDKSRFAITDGGDGTLYALSPWTAGWATGPASQFEKTRTKEQEPTR